MEITHSVKKIYRESEISAWLKRVDFDWERLFRPEALAYGRKLYKASAVRSLELSGSEALACARIDGEELYCVLDFDGDTYVRKNFNASDSLSMAALTVATFYEIEELVCDASAGVICFRDASESAGDSAGEHAEESAENAAEPSRNMPLRLSFTSRRRGLSFIAEWETEDGSFKRAFGESCVGVETLTQSEREALIRLASLARKASFRYDSDSYVLADIPKIPTFLALTPGLRNHG